MAIAVIQQVPIFRRRRPPTIFNFMTDKSMSTLNFASYPLTAILNLWGTKQRLQFEGTI